MQRHGSLVEDHQRVASSNWVERVFGSYDYLRLWIVQAVGSTGDWLGFLAIGAAATQLGGGTPETAVGFVFAVRIAAATYSGASGPGRRLSTFICGYNRRIAMSFTATWPGE